MELAANERRYRVSSMGGCADPPSSRAAAEKNPKAPTLTHPQGIFYCHKLILIIIIIKFLNNISVFLMKYFIEIRVFGNDKSFVILFLTQTILKTY